MFESDGLLSGHLGCNGLGVFFVGTFEQPEPIGVGSTDMGCEVKDWYEVAYVLQGVYDDSEYSFEHWEITGDTWLRTAYGLLELHDPAVVPSQTAEEAARDGVVPELAVYPYGVRVRSLLEVETDEGTWVLADLHAGGGLPQVVGDDGGTWPRDYVSRYDYGELLLTDGAGRILKAWPMPDLGPSWILLTDDRVYVGREQGACGLASAILRIDRATLETYRVAFSRSGDLHPYVLPGWHVADSEAMEAHLPNFWQPGTHDGEGVEAETFAIRYIVDVEAVDRFIDAVVAETDPVPADDWFC
ncbi:MAG: hypothetical protein H8E59_02745 [Actinobacteria bacterium]|nr:hypothetical protein [Actinomycetota bacterium]